MLRVCALDLSITLPRNDRQKESRDLVENPTPIRDAWSAEHWRPMSVPLPALASRSQSVFEEPNPIATGRAAVAFREIGAHRSERKQQLRCEVAREGLCSERANVRPPRFSRKAREPIRAHSPDAIGFDVGADGCFPFFQSDGALQRVLPELSPSHRRFTPSDHPAYDPSHAVQYPRTQPFVRNTMYAVRSQYAALETYAVRNTQYVRGSP